MCDCIGGIQEGVKPTRAKSPELSFWVLFSFLITEACLGQMANSSSHIFINLHYRSRGTKLDLILQIKINLVIFYMFSMPVIVQK